jgi:hypothetical protein
MAQLRLVRRINVVRIIIGVFGFILLFAGLIGTPITLLFIFDPVGTQMANDNNPFGTPPSLFGSILQLLFCLSIGVVGAFLVRRSIRKPSVSV